MDTSYQFTPSELIHLFIDGEADAAQQARLFSLMAADSDLQEKFRAALIMQQTLERVHTSARPPEHYTTELFAKAGFGTAAPQSLSLISRVSPKAREIILTLVSSAVGACITVLLLVPYVQKQAAPFGNTAPVSVAAKQTGASSSEIISSAAISQSGPTEQTGSRRNMNGTAARWGNAVNSTVSRSGNSTVAEAQRSLVAGNLTTTPDAKSDQQHSTQAEYHAVTSAPIAARQSAIHRDAPTAFALAELPVSEAQHAPLLTVYVQNIQALEWYPAREIPASTIAENISIGGLYHLTQEHAVGIEAGRELLPMYSFADDAQTLSNTLLWAGGVYRYQPEGLTIARTLDPFVRVVLGATSIGPMGRASLGVRLRTDGPFSAAFGVEGSSLLYRRGTTLHTTEKLGITLSAEVQF